MLKALGPCLLVQNQASLSACREFESLEPKQRDELNLAVSASILHLLNFETRLKEHAAKSSPIRLQIQSDQAGGEGDVRDIIISDENGWEIGISAKHQHEAVKHSRLSNNIDFGEKWLSIPCSENYFREIQPIFDHLARMKEKAALWSEITEKESTVYGAILAAFRREMLRIDSENPGKAAAALASYLIGRKDFYKIMKMQRYNKIQVFNFNGTLNQSSRSTKARLHLERLKLPRRIVELDFKIEDSGRASSTTLELICDGGWQISFRIHNASSRVEPSLKFDISLLGRPNSLPTFYVLW